MEPTTTTIAGERRARPPPYSALTSERLAEFGVRAHAPLARGLEHYLWTPKAS